MTAAHGAQPSLKAPRPIVLITNLSYVSIRGTGVRTMTNALVLEPADDDPQTQRLVGERSKVRGFAYSSANPTFDIHLHDMPEIAFTVADAASPHLFISTDGAVQPLSTGLILTIAGGPVLELMRQTHDDRGIMVERIEERHRGARYGVLWNLLDQRVGEFFTEEHAGLFQPVVVHLPAEQAKRIRDQQAKVWGQ